MLHTKLDKLKEMISDMGSVAVAFSAGVDSTFLLKVAHDLLGDRAIAITLKAASFPHDELSESEEFCRREVIRQIMIEINQLEIEGFRENPQDRCYICKKEMFRLIIEAADAAGIPNVIDGSNLNDTGDYRPGMRALSELGIKSPLKDCGLGKSDIRALSEELKLPTWSKPSYACLATRIPYGEIITEEKLGMIEHAEKFLRDLGFGQLRVRLHGGIARIEVKPDEIPRFSDEGLRSRIYSSFKDMGFDYVTVDIAGYRSGSMNEVLDS